jgi:hypothetical protein
MLYLPRPDQEVITDRNKAQLGLLGKRKNKCNKRVIINISEIRIYLWRVVGQNDYRDCGQYFDNTVFSDISGKYLVDCSCILRQGKNKI